MASYLGHWHFRGYGLWALEDKTTGAFVGQCGPWYPESWPEPEIHWLVIPEFQGQGVAKEPPCMCVNISATFHKRSDIQKAITQAGHSLEYLPPYSPHLNSIERKWAQAKAIRRQYQCPIEHIFKDKLNHFN